MPSEVMEQAFANLKDDICDGVAVKVLNPDKPFVVETDRSIHSGGAILVQSEMEEHYPTLL